MKTDVVTVRCKACQTPLQVPAGGKRLCACGTWVAAPPPTAKVVEEEPLIITPVDEEKPRVATAVIARLIARERRGHVLAER